MHSDFVGARTGAVSHLLTILKLEYAESSAACIKLSALLASLGNCRMVIHCV